MKVARHISMKFRKLARVWYISECVTNVYSNTQKKHEISSYISCSSINNVFCTYVQVATLLAQCDSKIHLPRQTKFPGLLLPRMYLYQQPFSLFMIHSYNLFLKTTVTIKLLYTGYRKQT